MRTCAEEYRPRSMLPCEDAADDEAASEADWLQPGKAFASHSTSKLALASTNLCCLEFRSAAM